MLICRCDIETVELPLLLDGREESLGRWLAHCRRCGNTYRTSTADANLHTGQCREKCPTQPACSNRGEKVGGVRTDCKDCGGKPIVLPVYGCSVHGTCTEIQAPADAAGVVHKSCQGCPERSIPQESASGS